MGRQAYLTKIALGRSAFEPVQTTASTSEYVQIASAQQERAHEHGRRLREAQNDVLASIGVVERRHSPSQGLPGSYEERLRELEEEDTVGHTLSITSVLTEFACTWWIGSLRERLLTFRYPTSHSFSRIIASERLVSGKNLIYGGFPSHLLSQFCVLATVHGLHVVKPIQRLLMKYGNAKQKRIYRRWRTVLNVTLRISLEVLFYPFSYYSYLQRIGLVPARPLLPHPKHFVPFSTHSPLVPFSIHHTALTSPTEFVKAVLTSPFVFVCLQRFFERWVSAVMDATIETTIIRPTNPDMMSPDEGNKERTMAILGLRQKSPKWVQNGIAQLLGFVGWGYADVGVDARSSSLESHGCGLPGQVYRGEWIEVGEIDAHNTDNLETPSVARNVLVSLEAEAAETVVVPISSLSEVVPFSPSGSPPLSPTVSEASHNDGDPRIRITTRGDLVEMEVRLPPHVLSSHTEVAGSGPPSPIQRDIGWPSPVRRPGMAPYHRVTQLSSEPSSMLGSVCKAQMVSLITLPVKLVTVRLVASHFVGGQPGHGGCWREYGGVGFPQRLDWGSIGALVSRLALCGMFELAIDLGLWGCQYWTVAWLGTRAFEWGSL